MNLEHFNRDQNGVSIDSQVQIPVFLIAKELKTRKLLNTLTEIGCDGSFCISDLCDLVLALVGFNDRPNELYDMYFDLLDTYSVYVGSKNKRPMKEALQIYEALVKEKNRRLESQ